MSAINLVPSTSWEEIQNKSSSRVLVLVTKEDFFEKDLFEDEIYERKSSIQVSSFFKSKLFQWVVVATHHNTDGLLVNTAVCLANARKRLCQFVERLAQAGHAITFAPALCVFVIGQASLVAAHRQHDGA